MPAGSKPGKIYYPSLQLCWHYITCCGRTLSPPLLPPPLNSLLPSFLFLLLPPYLTVHIPISFPLVLLPQLLPSPFPPSLLPPYLTIYCPPSLPFFLLPSFCSSLPLLLSLPSTFFPSSLPLSLPSSNPKKPVGRGRGRGGREIEQQQRRGQASSLPATVRRGRT